MTNLGDVIGMLPNCIIAYKSIIAFLLQPEVKATTADPRVVDGLAVALFLAPDPSSYRTLTLHVRGPEAISTAESAALYTEALGRPEEPVQPVQGSLRRSLSMGR